MSALRSTSRLNRLFTRAQSGSRLRLPHWLAARRHARSAWAQLEREARRQGCSPADVIFDWAGRVEDCC